MIALRAAIDNLTLIPYDSQRDRPPLSGRNSAVECQLPKLDVTGSIPVARSIFFLTIENRVITQCD